MNDQQQPKLYRQQIEELEQQRLAAVAKSDADFNNPAWLQQALELEHDAAVLARKQHNAIAGAYETLYIESQQMALDLAAARAEVARLRTVLHFMVGFLHEDVENIETAQKIIALARKTVKDAITTE